MTVPRPIDDVYDVARALADPTTSSAALTEIAHSYPELADSVAKHPHVSPELRAWLAAQNSQASARRTDRPDTWGGASPSASNLSTAYAPLVHHVSVAATVGKSRTRPVVAWVLVGAAAVTALVFAVLRGGDDGDGAAPPPASAPTTVDAGVAPPATSAPSATTSSAPIEASEAPSMPTPTPTATATPTPTPTPTSTADVRTLNDEYYCGLTGTVVAAGYTDRFEAIICDDADGLVYIGTNLETGSNIRLPASAAGTGYTASNGAVTYNLTPARLEVTGDSGVLVDEAIYSWQTW